jgi:uncharacterized protein (TIGR02145 family)
MTTLHSRSCSPLFTAIQGLMLFAVIAILMLFSCDSNYPPRIINTEFARMPGIGNNSFTVRVEASDPDLDELSYQWSAVEGSFTGAADQNEALWVAPASNSDDNYTVIIEVSDGKDQITDTLFIPVQAVRFAKLSGTALFTGCKIPVSGAVISIDGKTDTTDIDGSFAVDGIRVGRQTITASKPDFSTGTTDILVVEGLNNAVVRLTSSKYTCKLFGNIFGNMSDDPKPYYIVTILNPDNTPSELTNISSAGGDYEISGIPHGFIRLTVKDDLRARMETLIWLDTTEKEFNIAIPEPFRFTDTRDNHEYQAVRISSQIWMAENLAFIPRVCPSYEQGGIWVYGYSGSDPAIARATANYKQYGCLYDFPTAISDEQGNGRDICPPGWHLPDDSEWKSMERALGMDPIELDSTGWRFSGDIGKKVKFESGWTSDGNGSNSSSFSALPAGYRYASGGFLGIGGYATFWTASEFDLESAYRRYLYFNQLAIGRFNDFTTSGFSVRCVKDRE